jgi:hypothetical protein
MNRLLAVIGLLFVCGCVTEPAKPKPKQMFSQVPDPVGPVSLNVSGEVISKDPAGKLRFAGVAKTAGAKIQFQTSNTIQASGPIVVVTSGAGQTVAEEIETHTVGKSVAGFKKTSSTRYVVVHVDGTQDMTVKVIGTGATAPLPPHFMCEVLQQGAQWVIQPPTPINTTDPAVQEITAAASAL